MTDALRAAGVVGNDLLAVEWDLTPLGPEETEVTLTYDWSQVGPGPRQRLPFPPFPPEHLSNSLEHLSGLVTG